ncbi:MAG: right-handed parallel beta-helix repeat-containing protein, partial [Planctomycetaceae bacterium]
MRCAALWIVMTAATLSAGEREWTSHPPMRPLPAASKRPLGDGPAVFVDAARGDDRHDGSKDRPWKTLAHAIGRLEPGETLYLRGGTYYESVKVKAAGTADAPITVRAFPGELAILDAGHREFYESPASAWEPVPDGAPGEFRSVNRYERGGGAGNFGDSLVPLHRYLNFHDLRSKNELWHKGLSDRADDPNGLYCGPGVRRDPQTGRIHVRLAHTQLDGLGDRHYRGETDPRKVPLVVAGEDYALSIAASKHLIVQDLVIRGAQRAAVLVENSSDVRLEGVTLYGTASALRTAKTERLTLVDSRLRGHAAPWHSRAHHKYRAGAGYLVLANGQDFEFARCEFTDHHDGILLKDAENVLFHHNLVDHFNDDGVELGPKRTTGRMLIHQNLIRRCLLAFSLHGGRNPPPVEAAPGSGCYISRNVIDLREGIYKGPPTEPDPSGAYLNTVGHVASDHGGPLWPVCYVYHNTLLLGEDSWRDYYAFGWSKATRGTTRRVYNNIFVQIDGLPGLNFSMVETTHDFAAGGNLLWGLREGPAAGSEFFAAFRKTPKYQESRLRHPPGWTTTDLFADPKFAALEVQPTTAPP